MNPNAPVFVPSAQQGTQSLILSQNVPDASTSQTTPNAELFRLLQRRHPNPDTLRGALIKRMAIDNNDKITGNYEYNAIAQCMSYDRLSSFAMDTIDENNVPILSMRSIFDGEYDLTQLYLVCNILEDLNYEFKYNLLTNLRIIKACKMPNKNSMLITNHHQSTFTINLVSNSNN